MRRLGWGRRFVAIVAAGITLVAAGCTDSGPQDGRLDVAIGGLPDDVAGAVSVEGTGQSWRLEDNRTLTVRPGRYAVRVAPVRARGATAYGAEDVQQVEVKAGGTTRVDAGYKVTIPDTTKVVADPANPPIVAISENAVTLAAGEYANSLRVGDAIVVAEGPQTPDGLCRRVISIRRDGNQVIVATTPLKLYEALPNAAFAIEDSSTQIETSNNIGQQSVVVPIDDADGKDTVFEASIDYTGRKNDRVKPKAYLKIDQFDPGWKDSRIEWSLWGSDKGVRVDLTATLEYETEFGVQIPVAMNGEGRAEEDLIGGAAKFICRGPVLKLLRVGPIKLGCGLRGVAELDAEVKSGVDFSATVSGNHTMPVTWDLGSKPLPRGFTGWPPERSVDVDVLADGSVSAKAGLEVWLGGKAAMGLAELELVAFFGFGVDFEVDAAKLDAKAEAFFESSVEIRLDLPFEGLDGKVTLFERHQPVPPKWTKKLDKPDLPPTDVGVIAYTSDEGLFTVDPLSAEVVKVAEYFAMPYRIARSPNGRYLAGSFLPGASGSAQSPLLWDTETQRRIPVEGCRCSGIVFLDDTTMLGVETARVPGTTALVGQRLHYVDVASGKTRRVETSPRVSRLIGPGPTPGTVLALDESKPAPAGEPGGVRGPIDLVWIDAEGKETRRVVLQRAELVDGIGDTALSPDGRYLAAQLQATDPSVELIVVDLTTGTVTNRGNPYTKTERLNVLGTPRWIGNDTVAMQAFNLDGNPGKLVAYRNGQWYTVDTDPLPAAMALGSGQLQIVLSEKGFGGGKLYILSGRPYGDGPNAYANPGNDDQPIASKVLQILLPRENEPNLTLR